MKCQICASLNPTEGLQYWLKGGAFHASKERLLRTERSCLRFLPAPTWSALQENSSFWSNFLPFVSSPPAGFRRSPHCAQGAVCLVSRFSEPCGRRRISHCPDYFLNLWDGQLQLSRFRRHVGGASDDRKCWRIQESAAFCTMSSVQLRTISILSGVSRRHVHRASVSNLSSWDKHEST
jgi:hypothetical protein